MAVAVVGDVVIPVRFADAPLSRETDDYMQLCTDLHAQCCGSAPVHATSFLALSAHCHLDLSQQLHLEFEAMLPTTTLRATLLAPVPMVPTGWLVG